MREISDRSSNARLAIDDDDRVRDLSHVGEPRESRDDTPLNAAIEYIRQMANALHVRPVELRSLHQQISSVDPKPQCRLPPGWERAAPRCHDHHLQPDVPERPGGFTPSGTACAAVIDHYLARAPIGGVHAAG